MQGLIPKPCPKSWGHLKTPRSQSKNPLGVLGFTILHFPMIMGMCLSLEHSFDSLPCHALTSIMNPKLRLQQWLTSNENNALNWELYKGLDIYPKDICWIFVVQLLMLGKCVLRWTWFNGHQLITLPILYKLSMGMLNWACGFIR